MPADAVAFRIGDDRKPAGWFHVIGFYIYGYRFIKLKPDRKETRFSDLILCGANPV